MNYANNCQLLPHFLYRKVDYISTYTFLGLYFKPF